jgi:primary-amine oxidase
MGEYIPSLVPNPQQRTDLKPLEVHQPEGSSLTVDGNEVRWQKWSLRVGFNYREGLVIHRVAYDDDGLERPVAHRMSFAEMIVPYRDPRPDHYRRTAFDIGEWGLGVMTQSLELGCDCLGDITYLDAVLHDIRPVSPALHRRPSGPGGRRPGQHRARVPHRGVADLGGQPVRAGAGREAHPAAY